MPEISSDKQSSIQDKWSSYWSGNRVSACMQTNDGNYNSVIGQHWQTHFSTLADESRILDLATGNGAVLHFAIDTAKNQNKSFDLFGIDLAHINPWAHMEQKSVQPSRIQFLPNISIESLPFANNMFDSVVSQYGAEYASLEPTVCEAVRVLRASGTLNWICHSDTSVVYHNSCREIEDARYMLEQTAVIDHLSNIIQIQTHAGQFIQNSHQQTLNTPERQALQVALQACFNRLKQSPQHSEILDVFLQNLAYLYQHRESHSPELVLEKIDDIQTELVFFMQRLQALVNSALSAQKLELIQVLLEKSGMINISSNPILKSDGSNVGMQLLANKPNGN